ncbi:MAG: hypothetical protein ACLU98_07610 [Desulfovibrio fairfieldensis]
MSKRILISILWLLVVIFLPTFLIMAWGEGVKSAWEEWSVLGVLYTWPSLAVIHFKSALLGSIVFYSILLGGLAWWFWRPNILSASVLFMLSFLTGPSSAFFFNALCRAVFGSL